MKKVHWSGGINLPDRIVSKGWPACCRAGALSFRIRRRGLMEGKIPSKVTCEKCLVLLIRAGIGRK